MHSRGINMSKDVFLRRIWDGSIPVCFRLSAEELAPDASEPPPYFMLVPRVTYFPLVLEKVLRQMRTNIESPSSSKRKSLVTGDEARRSPLSGDLEKDQKSPGDASTSSATEHVYWLESDQHPLKWHYPVGLLYDLYGSGNNLPWDIYIHFENYPSDILLAPPINKSSVEAIFMSTVKEADALKHRGTVVSEMLPRDHRLLWMGFSNHAFDQFWNVNRRFMQPFTQKKIHRQVTPPSENPEDGNASDQQVTRAIPTEDAASLLVDIGMNAFRYCPIRLYFSPLPLGSSPSSTVAVGEDVLQTKPENRISSVVQTPIAPFQNSSNLPITFADVIETLFTSPTLLATKLNKKDFAFLVHGIELPQETPGQWMTENLAYPDNFVHIVARRRTHACL